MKLSEMSKEELFRFVTSGQYSDQDVIDLHDDLLKLRSALEKVYEELKTLHFMIDHDDDIFHERKKKYLSIIDYVGQSVAGQALSTTSEPTNAAPVKRIECPCCGCEISINLTDRLFELVGLEE